MVSGSALTNTNASTKAVAGTTTVDLEQRVRKLYDHLYANSSRKTPAGITLEVGKVLHAAQYLEEVRGKRPAFDLTGGESKALARGAGSLVQTVAGKVREDFAEMNSAWQLYSPETSIELSDTDLAFILVQLSGLSVTDRRRDVFGDTIEIIRSQWAKREGGMFFTDQRVTHLAMVLLDFDPRRGDDLVDISAGTGGFLSAALNHIRALLDVDNGSDVAEREAIRLACLSLKGQEIDPEVARVANATLASRTGRSDHTFVHVGDSIARGSFDENHPLGIQEGTHLCAATNPPFGTKTTIKEENTLASYDLARISNRLTASARQGGIFSRPPDILLLEKNLRLLRPGVGRLAIVLPYQLISGPQTQFVREWILKNAHVEAVIDLPAETFQPHTGTKTSLVVLRRRKKPLANLAADTQRRVFMAMPRWIGHDRRGNPVYETEQDGARTGRILSDLEDVETAFRAFREGKEPSSVHGLAFSVPEEKIFADPQKRMNALFHQPQAEGAPLGTTNADWEVVRLRDVVRRIFFPTRFKRNYVDWYEGAVPFLGGSNITEFILTSDKWLRHDDPRLDQLRVRSGWILVTRSGSTGIVSSVPAAWDGFAMSEHVIRIVPADESLPGEYIQAFLRTNFAQSLIAKGVFGSVIDEITPEFLGELEMPVPKDQDVLDRIVSAMAQAELSRQAAVEAVVSTVQGLNVRLPRP